MDNIITADYTKVERRFLTEELGSEPNGNGVFLYHSADGNEMLKLDCVLQHYKDWLIENKILIKP